MSNETTTENVEITDNVVETSEVETVAEVETPQAVETKSAAPKRIADLAPKMKLEGKVLDVKLYGAFVDLGVERPGLLHISQLSDKRVQNVTDVVNTGDSVTVYVLDVDSGKGRVNLSLLKPPARTWEEMKVNDVVTGSVVRIEKFGAFIDIGAERPGLIHVSELANDYVGSTEDVVKMGDEVEARIINIDRRKKQVDLSIRAMEVPEPIIDEDDDDDDGLTAMAIAWQQAVEGSNKNKKKDAKRRKDKRSEQDDIIARTLRNSQ